jgi:hypothetical protein
MLTLRIKIFVTRIELFLLDNILILPQQVKENLGKKIHNNIKIINKDLKEKNIL